MLLSDGLPESDSLALVLMLSLMATMLDRNRDTRPRSNPVPHPFREAYGEWRATRVG